MAIDAQKEGELGCLVAMYHIIGKGASPGISPETGKERTVKYEKWMETKISLPPTSKTVATKFNNMLKGFDVFLSNGDKVNVTRQVMKGRGKSKMQVTEYVNAAWVNTWISQALAVQKILSGKKSWKYGWFNEGKISNTGIPSTLTTSSLLCVWDDVFSKIKEIKNEFNGKKDNWCPADVFISTDYADKKIHTLCDESLKQFLSVSDKVKMDDPDLMKRFVGSVNMELVKLVNEGELIPISLKAQTSKVTMKAKSTNILPIPGGELSDVRGWFTEVPYCYSNVVTGKKGKDEIDFKGNSFFFRCHINLGGYGSDYQIEQRMQGKSPDKSEIKDVRKTDGGDTKPANAQAGQVPSDKFKNLIKKWAEVGTYDYNIPKVGTSFTDDQLQYWAKEMDDISNQNFSLGESGTTKIDLGDFEILGRRYQPSEYWTLLGQLDDAPDDKSVIEGILGQKLEKGNFSAKIRNRCYQLRFMRALANAYNDKMTVKGKGEAQLCMLLVRLYYLAAKMKMKDDDLNGPFYKVA